MDLEENRYFLFPYLISQLLAPATLAWKKDYVLQNNYLLHSVTVLYIPVFVHTKPLYFYQGAKHQPISAAEAIETLAHERVI